MGSLDAALENIKEQLIPKIKSLCKVSPKISTRPRSVSVGISTGPQKSQITTPKPVEKKRVDIVVIGISTGGPNALSEIMPGFPANFPVPILIVQHMPATFTKLLAERLSTRSVLKVKEGFQDAILNPGEIYIAPGDYHMTVARQGAQYKLQLNQEPPENSCRPAVDVLFRSASSIFGASTLAVVMTGMGQDGLRGCELIRQAGGQILAQDEASSVVWGMPGFVANAGLADKVVPLNQIAQEITRRTLELRRS